MADNLTHYWSAEQTTEKKTANYSYHRDNYTFNAINTSAASKIPPYSQIKSATVSVTGEKDPKGTFKYGRLRASFSNTNTALTESGNKVFLLDLVDKEDLTYKTIESGSADILSYIKNKTSNAGYIEYSDANCILVYLNFTAIYSQGYTSTVRIDWTYNEPRAIVSVSGGSGGGTYAYESSIKLTANSKAGHTHSGWTCSNGKTYTVKQLTDGLAVKDLITAYETSLTFTPTYTVNNYTISTAVTPTGGGTVTGGGSYQYGKTATLTATPATGYKFKYWQDNSSLTNATRTVTVSGAATYTAVFEKLTYTATFKNGDGSTLETVTVEHGKTPTCSKTPTKASTAEYTYTFSGWTPALGALTANQTYTPNFTATKRSYTVTFKDENGSSLKSESVQYGANPTPPTTPTKADTAQWKYTFDGWYDANGNKWTSSTTITGATTYTARYSSTVQKYTVRWYNYDGSLLETDTEVAYGTKPTYNGAEPTKAGNAEHSYKFAGWNYDTENGITPTLGTTYIDITAQFTEIDNTYTVKWVNEGKVIETDTLVPYGDKPDYNGATPTKASDAQYDYTFIGWSASVSDPAKPEDELETVKGDVTYTAVYSGTVKFYSIKVILFDSEEDYVREYNTELTIEAPAVKGYRFVKWSDGNTNASRTITVTGAATYQAIYEAIPIPTYVNDKRAKAVYVDLNSKTAFIVIDGAVPETTPDNNTVDGWRFKVTNTIPTGDGVKVVEQMYRNAQKIYQA